MALYKPTIIDLLPADNVAYRTQEQWIAFFNEQRKQMISAADVYQAGKSASDELLESLRNDFNVSLLVSSTRISYSGDDLSGRITHNFGSKVVRPSQTDVSVIPVYDGTPLSQALQSDDGIAYLQFLFDTNDEPQDITGTLENLSKREVDRIALWTPSQSSRNSYNERAVWFEDYLGRFLVVGVDGFFIVNGNGRSRGASISPRSGRAKK